MCQKTEWNGIIKNMPKKDKLIYKIFLSFAILNFSLLSPSLAQDEVISKLEHAYKKIIDVSGNFVQISYIKDLDKTQKFSGKFFIKGDKIRWQYSGENPQIIYINKENLIVYDVKAKQAIKSKFHIEKYGQLPLALLSRMAIIKRDFEVNKISENNIMLKPKEKMGNIEKIELSVNEEDFPIKSMKIRDTYGNIIQIDFNSLKINTNLKDSLFKFIPRNDDTVLTY